MDAGGVAVESRSQGRKNNVTANQGKRRERDGGALQTRWRGASGPSSTALHWPLQRLPGGPQPHVVLGTSYNAAFRWSLAYRAPCFLGVWRRLCPGRPPLLDERYFLFFGISRGVEVPSCHTTEGAQTHQRPTPVAFPRTGYTNGSSTAKFPGQKYW